MVLVYFRRGRKNGTCHQGRRKRPDRSKTWLSLRLYTNPILAFRTKTTILRLLDSLISLFHNTLPLSLYPSPPINSTFALNKVSMIRFMLVSLFVSNCSTRFFQLVPRARICRSFQARANRQGLI
jgi:hypothetical protein